MSLKKIYNVNMLVLPVSRDVEVPPPPPGCLEDGSGCLHLKHRRQSVVVLETRYTQHFGIAVGWD